MAQEVLNFSFVLCLSLPVPLSSFLLPFLHPCRSNPTVWRPSPSPLFSVEPGSAGSFTWSFSYNVCMSRLLEGYRWILWVRDLFSEECVQSGVGGEDGGVKMNSVCTFRPNFPFSSVFSVTPTACPSPRPDGKTFHSVPRRLRFVCHICVVTHCHKFP